MALQPLDEVRRELTGAWDMGRAGFWWRAAESSAISGDWGVACNRLLHLADPLDNVPAGSPAWRQLVVAAFDAAIRAGSSDLVTAVASQILDRGFRSDDSLAPFRTVLATAEAIGAADQGYKLGLILARRFPRSALGQYAAAHFDELSTRSSGRAPLDPQRTAAGFDRAAELFEAAGERDNALHTRLRSAVVRMTWTSQNDEARRALTAVSRDGVPDNCGYWLAFGRAHSPFWLDRVRAADWCGDTLDSSVSGAPLAAAHIVAEHLFGMLPVQLSDAERDRLESLLATFEDSSRWELEAQLRGRDAIVPEVARSLHSLSSADAQALEDACLPLDGFAPIASAWAGHPQVGRPKHPAAAAVVDVLLALQQESDALADALNELARALAKTPDARELRPVLLALVRSCEQPPKDPAVVDALEEVALHYARRAPVSPHGFVAVAGMLFMAGLQRAGAAATQRAIDEAERAEGIEICVARSMQWAARDGSDREMLHWLEIGERAFA